MHVCLTAVTLYTREEKKNIDRNLQHTHKHHTLESSSVSTFHRWFHWFVAVWRLFFPFFFFYVCCLFLISEHIFICANAHCNTNRFLNSINSTAWRVYSSQFCLSIFTYVIHGLYAVLNEFNFFFFTLFIFSSLDLLHLPYPRAVENEAKHQLHHYWPMYKCFIHFMR